MLGILFIYFIGKYFYELADKYNKKKWLHAILGIAIYYLGSMIGGGLLGILYAILYNDAYMKESTEILLTVLSVPIGLAFCWFAYFIFKRKWEDDVVTPHSGTI